jgi:hypothetical protein
VRPGDVLWLADVLEDALTRITIPPKDRAALEMAVVSMRAGKRPAPTRARRGPRRRSSKGATS